jgi:hypothetical protein
MPIDRRNQTALGRRRRREFFRSVQKLRALGMPDWAVEYYRRAARVAGLPPHMVVCHVAVVAAGRQLQANIAQEEAATKGAPGAPGKERMSYDGVQAMRRRVTTLWREIEQHGTLPEAAGSDATPRAALKPETLSSIALAEKLTMLRPQAANPEPAVPRSRKRKASPKGH